MTTPGEKIESLEEKFIRLREEGIEDKEIIKKIFEENPEANVGEICQITGMDALSVGRIKGQVVRWKKLPRESDEEISKPTAPEEAEEAVPPLIEGASGRERGLSDREFVAQYGEEGLETIKKRLLMELLEFAPGVGKPTIKWITKQWQLDINVRRDLNQLHNVLTTSGVKNEIAMRICNALQALEDEYADVLQAPSPPLGYYRRPDTRAGQQHPPFPRRTQPGRYDYGGYPLPDYGYPGYPLYHGYPPYPQPPLRIEDVERVIEEKLKKDASTQPPQQTVTITEPARDADGKPLFDKDGNPIYRKIMGPLGQVGGVSQEDSEMAFLRKAQGWKTLFGDKGEPLSEDRIRTIIREEGGKKDVPITKEDISKAVQEGTATVLATKEKVYVDYRRHQEIIAAIQESGGSKAVEGYHQDSFRLLGQSLDSFAKREPKATKAILDFARDLLLEEPSPKVVEPGARASIFEKVSEKYVSEEGA